MKEQNTGAEIYTEDDLKYTPWSKLPEMMANADKNRDKIIAEALDRADKHQQLMEQYSEYAKQQSNGFSVPAYPDNNPKTAIGSKKVPLHLIPPAAKHYLALALENGASKYGAYNWRDKTISVSVYKAALERHMDAFWDGEDVAVDSGLHHVAHAMACCALILDAMSIGKLNDDRPTKGAASRLQEEYYKKE